MNDNEFGIIRTGKPGEEPYCEYYLPIGKHNRAKFRNAGPWISQIVGATVEEAQAILAKRWARASPGLPRQLCDLFLTYSPRAVVDVHGQYSLLCVKPETSECHDTMYCLGEPPDIEATRQMLLTYGADNEQLLEFLCLFGGMRDWYDYDAGILVTHLDRIMTVAEMYLLNEADYREWEGGFVIWWGPNGDGLIYHPSGRVGWVVVELATIKLYTNTFTEFCERYFLFQRDAWKPRTYKIDAPVKLAPRPFDSWAAFEHLDNR